MKKNFLLFLNIFLVNPLFGMDVQKFDTKKVSLCREFISKTIKNTAVSILKYQLKCKSNFVSEEVFIALTACLLDFEVINILQFVDDQINMRDDFDNKYWISNNLNEKYLALLFKYLPDCIFNENKKLIASIIYKLAFNSEESSKYKPILLKKFKKNIDQELIFNIENSIYNKKKEDEESDDKGILKIYEYSEESDEEYEDDLEFINKLYKDLTKESLDDSIEKLSGFQLLKFIKKKPDNFKKNKTL